MKITDDYEKFVKQFYSKHHEILDRAFCIFPTFLCRVDLYSSLEPPPDSKLPPWRGDSKSGGLRHRVDPQGSTIKTSQLEASI